MSRWILLLVGLGIAVGACEPPVECPEDQQRTFYADADGDLWGDPARPIEACEPPPGHTDKDGDCDDAEPTAAPDLTEVCGDGVDNDCDGGRGGCTGLRPTLNVEDADFKIVGVWGDDLHGSTAVPSDAHPGGDLIVQTYGDETAGQNAAGVVYFLEGPLKDGFQLSPAEAVLRGEEELSALGQYIADLGPADDGTRQLAVSAAGVTEALYLFELRPGDPAETADAIATYVGDPTIGAGMPVPAGDLDADGHDDLLVYSDPTSVHLVFGPLVGEHPIPGAGPEFSFAGAGQTVALAGQCDVNGDGADDFVVGRPHVEVGGEEAGTAGVVEIYLGPLDPDPGLPSPSLRLEGSTTIAPYRTSNLEDWYWAELGEALGWETVCTDLDLDGEADLLARAALHYHPHGEEDVPADEAGGGSGAVHLFAGPLVADLGSASASILPGPRSSVVGTDLLAPGDVNGDSIPDLVMTGSVPVGEEVRSSVLVFYGPFEGTRTTAEADSVIVRPLPGGTTIESGDVNGDGYADILIADRGDTEGGPQAGAIHVFLGGPGL